MPKLINPKIKKGFKVVNLAVRLVLLGFEHVWAKITAQIAIAIRTIHS